MLNEMLTPVLEKRSWEVVALCEEKNDDVYLQLTEILGRIKDVVPEEMVGDLNNIEGLFLQKNTDAIRMAHRLGFEDCRKLFGQLKSVI